MSRTPTPASLPRAETALVIEVELDHIRSGGEMPIPRGGGGGVSGFRGGGMDGLRVLSCWRSALRPTTFRAMN